ncbi:MAG: hypothetical protein AAGE76_04015 [Pseudomonadota bacterium]
MTIDLRQLVFALVGVQTAFLIVFSAHFFVEPAMIGGNEALYDHLRERLAVYDVGPEAYDFQFMNWAYSDAADYLVGIAGEETREPFRFRVIYIWLITGLNGLVSTCETVRSECGLGSVALVAKLVNWVGILATFRVIQTISPDRMAPVTLALATAGALNFGTFLTAPFVMADILCGLVFALAARFFLTRQFLALVATVATGVLVKEICIVLGVLIAAELLRVDRKPLPLILIGGAAPLAAFVGIRLAMGSDPLSLNYGWEVSQGYFEIRYVYLHAEGYFIPFLTKTLFGAGIGALFLLTTLRHGPRGLEIWTAVAVCLALMTANLLLASGVVRVAAPLAPLLSVFLLHRGLYLTRRGGDLARAPSGG